MSPPDGRSGESDVEEMSGLRPGVEVRLTLVSGRRGQGRVVSVEEDGLALRPRPGERKRWVAWSTVRSLRVGRPGPRSRPGQPTTVEAIRALVASADGGVIPAREAYSTLAEQFGFSTAGLRSARRRAGVIAYFDPYWETWMWRMGPSEREEDDRAHGL